MPLTLFGDAICRLLKVDACIIEINPRLVMGKEMNTFFMLCLRIENWILRWSVVSLERRLLTLELSLQIPRKLRLSGCFLPFFFFPIFHCDYRSLSLTYVSPPPGGGKRDDDVLREDLKTSETWYSLKSRIKYLMSTLIDIGVLIFQFYPLDSHSRYILECCEMDTYRLMSRLSDTKTLFLWGKMVGTTERPAEL